MEQRNAFTQNRSVQPYRTYPKKRAKKRVGLGTLLICMLMTSLMGGVLGGYLTMKMTGSATAAIAEPSGAEQNASTLSSAAVLPASLASTQAPASLTKAQVIEFAAPSAVGIDVTYAVSGTNWFGQRVSSTESGSGSGIIVSEDGYIVTCYHVIENASTIEVILNDDSQHAAGVVGFDARNDLAVIKIDASALRAVTLGDSDMLTVGEDVIAIGNPLGELRGTATSGIISALDRRVTVEDTEMQLIQTDAAVSPGNSGGGLFNAFGTLIGIVNAKAGSDNAEGLAFAIPVNSVKDIIADLMDLGYVRGRAYLGVYTQNVTMQTRFSGWGDLGGNVSCVEVSEVIDGGAAALAGIRQGDLLLSVDGTEISSNADLSGLIGAYNAGDTANITIQRGTEKRDLSVTFGEYAPAS